MKLSIEEVVAVNRRYGGVLVRAASLEFALDLQLHGGFGEFTKLAHLWRALLVDHPFSDGNKRTAMYVAFVYANENGWTLDERVLSKEALAIASMNITSIRAIAQRIKHAKRDKRTD